MSNAVKMAAALVVTDAMRPMLAEASVSDAGDVLNGALAGVVWSWLSSCREPEDMRRLFHRTADEHFNRLIPSLPARAGGSDGL